MIPLCRYILQGGNSCQQAAITGEHYCRHHLVVRRTVAANTPKPNPYRIEKPLPLVFPEDRAALQINIFVVMQAFNEGDIGHKSAHIFTRLLHECAVNLKQGPLYDSDHENAVRRVVVTPEGEEIAPAREVPEGSASGEDCASSEDSASSESRFAQNGGEAVSGEAVEPSPTSQNRDAEHPDLPVSHTSDSSLCGPSSGEEAGAQNDFACSDPCYVENLTRRREQYRAHALCDLAAGRDPRAWEDFIPGKSKARRPKAVASCW